MRPQPIPTHRLPILRIWAGTRAGVRLAEAAAARFGDGREGGGLVVVVALAGAATVPRGCRVDAIGGGPADLAGAAAAIDALDPFDRAGVKAVRDAAQAAGVQHLGFRPPVWHRHPLDRWVEVRDLAGAAGAVASIARTVLLSLPERDLAPFEAVGGLRFPVRLTRPPVRWDRPERFAPSLCPGPSCREAEIRLLRSTGAQAVVMRATGAEEDAPLVLAARSLDLPVVMIRRPTERGEVPARSVDAALDWVEAILAGISRRSSDVPAWR